MDSRNNEEEVLEVIRSHPWMVLREEHFASLRINWNDKATNLREIAEELNIGTDALVFFDDDPANRELVRQTMPEVCVVDVPEDPALYASALRSLNDFSSLQLTADDFKKGESYHHQKQRRELRRQKTELTAFIASLGQRVEVSPPEPFTIPRIAQLTMKTNQFNLTTRRYSVEDIQRLSEDRDTRIRVFRVTDRFGDSGYVGVFIVQESCQAEWRVDCLLLSCRAIGRMVEAVMLNEAMKVAREAGASRLVGEYIPSGKNAQTELFYPSHGFRARADGMFVRDIPEQIEHPESLEVVNF